jgi:hypothetical protein
MITSWTDWYLLDGIAVLLAADISLRHPDGGVLHSRLWVELKGWVF